ncbi:MAG: hypothetical protein ABIK79_06805 [Chloroflexota bacterium]
MAQAALYTDLASPFEQGERAEEFCRDVLGAKQRLCRKEEDKKHHAIGGELEAEAQRLADL